VKRHLPPLNALRVFEVAAKSESFSRAAEILCVTQSAISKQIRLLEKHLDTILFERLGGIVIPTSEGKQYLAVISKALDTIELGSEKFYEHQSKETLTINIAPSLSALWMFSRVNDFHKLHPDIILHINSADDDIDWNKNDIDVAIRCLPRDKKHTDAELLLEEQLLLIATKQQLESKPINSIADLQQHQCISFNNRPQLWEDFFEQHQLDKTKIISSFGCEHFYMVIQATLKHLGVGLVADFLCQDFIEKQQLINPLDIKIASNYGYYLIIPPHKRDQKKVISFTHWIKEQLQ
jgi:DNA-binding transcriptional LysR family regulator